MARTTLQYTQPGTVAHGHIIKDGAAVFTSFELDGGYFSTEKAENMVRKIYDRSFLCESVTHYGKVYTMSTKDFIEHATELEIIEK